ncbi:hypothetical protein J4Q44_G00121460 [Coregonus suidteri]|uniref:Uncharacterized protein n=1 Tax=Coregonus suidteri TaxID=861788 RepID=A0AAN8QYF6_9TELE
MEDKRRRSTCPLVERNSLSCKRSFEDGPIVIRCLGHELTIKRPSSFGKKQLEDILAKAGDFKFEISRFPPRCGEGQPGPRVPPVPLQTGPPGPPRPLVASSPGQPTFVVSSGYPALETFLGLPVLPGPPGPPGPEVAGSVGPITDTCPAMLVSDITPDTLVTLDIAQLYEHFK